MAALIVGRSAVASVNGTLPAGAEPSHAPAKRCSFRGGLSIRLDWMAGRAKSLTFSLPFVPGASDALQHLLQEKQFPASGGARGLTLHLSDLPFELVALANAPPLPLVGRLLPPLPPQRLQPCPAL